MISVKHDLRFYSYRYGHVTNMHHTDLYAALGLDPKRKLPDAGLGPQYIGNVCVWVVPRVPGTNQDAKRVWCRCPYCHRDLTAGKYHQHWPHCEARPNNA